MCMLQRKTHEDLKPTETSADGEMIGRGEQGACEKSALDERPRRYGCCGLTCRCEKAAFETS